MKWLKENRIIMLLVVFQLVLIGFIMRFGGTLDLIQMAMVAVIILVGIMIDIWVYISFLKIREKDLMEQQMETMRKEQMYERDNLKLAQSSILHMKEKREEFYHALDELYQRCEAGRALEEIRSAYEDTSQCLTNMKIAKYCESPIINAVLHAKSDEAKLADIHMKVAIDELTDNMGVERIDMCSVFCNLLDNAIEACHKVDSHRFVHVRTQRKGEYLSIVVENASAEKPMKRGKGFRTTKNRTAEHGYGTKILSMIAEKYDGRFYLDEEAGSVKAVVLLKVEG